MRKGGTLSYFANDHLDGTAVVMDSSGQLVSRNRYHAYGMGWAQEGAPPTDRLYTGQRRYGEKSGMYFYNARFYGADVGRFTQADTFMPPMPAPGDLNRYSYVNNSPVTYSDPTGHFGVLPGFGSGGAGAPLTPGWEPPPPPPQDTQGKWYRTTCSVWFGSAAGWRIELRSTFHFNFETLWQELPIVDTSGTVNAGWSWSGVRARNSVWSETVRFADAWGTANFVFKDVFDPIPGLSYVKYVHLWIQEDAWGNCTSFWDVRA